MTKKNKNSKITRQLNKNMKLSQARTKLKKELEGLAAQYEAKMSSLEKEHNFIDRLPLETLEDYQAYAAGLKTDFNLQFFDKKRALEKLRDQKIEELKKIDIKMDEGQIDLALKKIEALLIQLKEK